MAKQKGAVVVTGASTGIGRATALHLDEQGYRVFAGVRKQADADSIAAEGSDSLTPLTIDVTEPDSIAAAKQEVEGAVGRDGLAGLVNNAGVANAGPVEFLPVEDFQQVIDVNLTGQYAVDPGVPQSPPPRRRHDRLHHLDRRPCRLPFFSPYNAAKFGSRGWPTRCGAS